MDGVRSTSGTTRDFGLLGPLLVRIDGRPVDVTSRMHRGVLAMLLLSANRVVSVGALVDGLWGDDPPPTAAGALQVHLGKVRRLVDRAGDPARIVTRSPGYVIEADPDEIDVSRFEDEVRRARVHLAASRPAQASALLGRALAMWRGPALSDVADLPFALPAATRLEEARLAALSDRIDADLDRGAHQDVVGELREITSSFPLRERFWEQLMVALYRSGNQADALDAFRRARGHLVEGLGLEPGSGLRDLEVAVLEQAPELNRPQAAVRPSVDLLSTIHDAPATDPVGHVEHAGVRHEITGRLTIGRDPANHVTIDDGRVSRRHAEIRATAEGVILRDLGSTNGTVVNGANVDHVPLRHGDTIVIGDEVMTVWLSDPLAVES